MWETLNNRIHKLTSGQPVSQDDLIWWGLVFGLVFASVHLVTMLITRWGDRKISLKSLVASVLVHLTCGLGVVVMEPLAPVGSEQGFDDEAVYVQEVNLETGTEADVSESSELPFWNRPTETTWTPHRLEPERLREEDPLEPDPQPLDREVAEQTPEIRVEPELSVEAPDDRPESEATPDDPLEQVADRALRLDDPLPFDDLINRETVNRERLSPLRPGQMTEQVDREARQGISGQVATELNVDATLRNLAADVETGAVQPEGAVAEDYETPTAPVRSDLALDESGGPTGDAAGVAVNTARLNPQRQRLETRLPNADPNGTATEVMRETNRSRLPLQPSTESPPPVFVPPRVARIDGPRPNPVTEEGVATISRAKGEVAPLYQLRDQARRRENALRYGGTEATEAAVEASLRWLASVQEAAGNWDANRFGSGRVKFDEQNVDRMNAGIEADTGITALATLAFLGAGNTHEVGEYTQTVDRALNWLIDQQADDGNFFGQSTHFARMYCHGMTTYALAEAYGMQSDPAAHPRLRIALQRGINFIIQRQNADDGGWRYRVGQAGDMSMFGWQLMALKSAEIAGLPVPATVKNRMIDFLNERSLGRQRGLAAYRTGEKVTAAMTAESLFCKQMLGIPRDDPACNEAVSFILRYRPNRADYNLYYWYYGTLAMRHYGGVPYQVWNDSIQNLLVSDQVKSGPNSGSWNNTTRWGAYGGRIYSTALSTLCLEAPYRHLPLYRTGPDDPETQN